MLDDWIIQVSPTAFLKNTVTTNDTPNIVNIDVVLYNAEKHSSDFKPSPQHS